MASYKEREEAFHAATEHLMKLEVGRNKWAIEVWRNGAYWFWALRWGCLYLYWSDAWSNNVASNPAAYHLLIGEENSGTGMCNLDYLHNGEEPNELLRKAVPQAIEGLQKWVDTQNWLKEVQL